VVAYSFTTFAGQASVGNTDGTGIAARFNSPNGIAIDGAGNLYIADTYNHVVRRITPSGAVTTLAGSGRQGTADGTGAASEFSAPHYIAVDTGGTVYVSGDESKIRRISPAGDVTSLGAAGGIYVAVTGEDNLAPGALAVDALGNLYAISFDMHVLLKITPTGVASIVAGRANEPGSADGTGSAARFSRATGIAMDRGGTLYVNDENGVRRITTAGVVTTVLARTRTTTLSGGLAVDSGGNIYVADGGTAVRTGPSRRTASRNRLDPRDRLVFPQRRSRHARPRGVGVVYLQRQVPRERRLQRPRLRPRPHHQRCGLRGQTEALEHPR
jgi:sugar lactone lactonase YvrE